MASSKLVYSISSNSFVLSLINWFNSFSIGVSLLFSKLTYQWTENRNKVEDSAAGIDWDTDRQLFVPQSVAVKLGFGKYWGKEL